MANNDFLMLNDKLGSFGLNICFGLRDVFLINVVTNNLLTISISFLIYYKYFNQIFVVTKHQN